MRPLYMSGYADAVVLESGGPEGALPFIQKPFTLRQLAEKIQEVLGQQASQDHQGG